MAYTAIADTGILLTDLLKKHLVPDVIKTPDQIGLLSPSDKSDCSVRVWLYDIRECGQLRSHTMISTDCGRQKFPPVYVDLFYMITARSDSDITCRAREEQYLLGKILQVLNDYAVIRFPEEDDPKEQKNVCSVSLLNLSVEEKMQIFSMPDTGYRTSLFYEVGPVPIASAKDRQVKRAVDLQFSLEEMEKK